MRVLLVDDSKTMRKILKKNLEGYAFEYFEAENGQIALGYLVAHDFDLVITDVNMPEMDGYSMCHHIRSMDRNKNVKIMVLSTETPGPETMQKLMISDFVIKPPPPGEVEAKIEKILGLPTLISK